MSEETVLSAEARTRAGKGANRAVRRQGRIPGVIYGGNEPPQMVSLDVPQVTRAHATGKMTSRLYSVEIGGKKTRVIPREVQVDPVYDKPIHVDLMRVTSGSPVTLNIPVQFKGMENSPGIKRGGVLNIVRHEIEMIVDPDNIPDHIEASLDGLDINDSLHISAITLPSGTRPRIARNFTVATVVAPSGHAEEVAEAAAKAAAAAAAGVVEGAPAEGAPAAGAPAAGAPAAAEKKEAGAKDEKKK
ncbi:MAG TPA: 50S ribosomal protein L25/general stress protein Ctc [Alphaproteobacteria bacterium]|nr:50S ribosomal protein L25/general stress protein Ctc [Alphaproteobacteria bacterium]